MTVTDLSEAEKNNHIKLITDNAQRIFLWNYDREPRPARHALQQGAWRRSGTRSPTSTGSTDVDPEQLVDTSRRQPNLIVDIAREAAQGRRLAVRHVGREGVHRSSASSRSRRSCSQFMHGEQGAMMVAAKIVETVPWIDAKYYAATQTMDEARHTEVFAKYLAHQAGRGVPDEPVPRGADRRADRGQPLGHRLPRHADRHREPGPGRVRRRCCGPPRSRCSRSCCAT